MFAHTSEILPPQHNAVIEDHRARFLEIINEKGRIVN